MSSISLCMIVKNEEEVLERCLNSVVNLVEEIIIVDTGSTDKTKDIAKQFTSNIYDFKWIDDFAAARNYSFSLAKKDYCMWLDADDVLLEEDRVKFKKMKQELTEDINAVLMKYNTGFDNEGNPIFTYYRERIIKNNSKMKWKGFIHEAIELIGKSQYWDCAVTHKKNSDIYSKRNLQIFKNKIKEGYKLDPRLEFYYGRELYYHGYYREALDVFENFINQGQGWIENNIDACRHCAYCQYALQREKDALCWLLRTLAYDRPRAEACCEIAGHFFDRNKYEQAIYWYLIALTCKQEDNKGGFVSLDCYGYIPCIQLCVCFSRIGNLEKAILFNDIAEKLKPNSNAVKQNKLYFSQFN